MGMPDDALRLVLQFLLELQHKISEIIYDITHRETKINPDTMRELRDKEQQIYSAIMQLRDKVGHTERTDSFQLVGGAPRPAYSLDRTSDEAQQSDLSRECLMEMMKQEMLHETQ